MVSFYDIRKFFDKESLRDAMNTVSKCGVPMNLYRLWFLLNQKTEIEVSTGVGKTDRAKVGELIGQGSSGGALISAANLDDGVREALGRGWG